MTNSNLNHVHGAVATPLPGETSTRLPMLRNP